MKHLLDIKDLSIGFNTYGQNRPVLHKVNLYIDEGERVALIGQSGSGKTVTMRTVIGTLPMPPGYVNCGSILYEGHSLLDLSKQERNRLKGTGISIVLQDPMLSFNPVLTIKRQMDDIVRYSDIRMGIQRSSKDREAHLIETLRKVRLQDAERILESYPMMLSGGMRQRVLIGMALLNNPKLLIADEPGTALDVTTQDEILTLLNNLVAEEGLSLLLITHNLGVVRKMADRVYVMEHGKIVENGTRDTIFSSPKHEYTKKLMAAVPPLYGNKVRTLNYQGSNPAIELNNVTKDFETRSGFFNSKIDTFRAANKVTLSIHKGDIYGIAGESGSGKTTVAKMILGLTEPSDGDIKLFGRSINKFKGTSEFRKLIQIVYQNPGSSLNPRRTVADQLAVPLQFSGYETTKISKRIRELLDLVDLPQNYAGMYPHELSGGQKQRVAIARALSVNPKILVLDEPTSALDVLVQSTVIDLLNRLRQEFDLTYIFISHDLSLMRNFCNRVAIMFRGNIIESGNVDKIFDDPSHAYTRALLSAIPVISQEEEIQKPKIDKKERDEVLASSTVMEV